MGFSLYGRANYYTETEINTNAFELDSDGDYQPVTTDFYDPFYDMDANGDIMPEDEICQLDSSGNLMPI